MREMTESNISSYGKVPSSWECIKLKNILTLRSIKSGGVGELLSVYLDRGVISYSDSDGQQVHKPSQDMSNYQIVKIGDFVLNNQQAWRGSVGVSKYDGIISPAYFVYDISEKCDPLYMNFALRDGCMVQQYETASRGVGTIQRNLFAPWLLDSIIVLPSLPEQHRIATFLDEKCNEIDHIASDIQEQIDILEAYRRSIITEIVTQGLNHDVQLKESGIEWAKLIPQHWEVKRNKYLMKKYKEISPVYHGEDILSLTVHGVIVRDLDAGGKMPTSFDGYQRLYPGNLLMCLFDYDVTPRCIGLIKNQGVTSPAYSQFIMSDGNDAGYYYYYYLMIDFTKELLHLAIKALWDSLRGVVKTPTTKAVETVTQVVKEIPPEPIPDVVTAIASNSEALPFEVSRHIRNLPSGWHASPEKIAEALKNNIILMDGQTWVGSYMKGVAAA